MNIKTIRCLKSTHFIDWAGQKFRHKFHRMFFLNIQTNEFEVRTKLALQTHIKKFWNPHYFYDINGNSLTLWSFSRDHSSWQMTLFIFLGKQEFLNFWFGGWVSFLPSKAGPVSMENSCCAIEFSHKECVVATFYWNR